MQTSYDYNHPIAIEGMLADSARNKVAESFWNEEASSEVFFGKVLQQGTGDRGALRLTATNNKLVGILIHTHAVLTGANGGVEPKGPLSLLTNGHIYVRPEDAVTPASVPYVRAVAAGNEVAGAFRGSADSTDTIRLWGCRFLASCAAGGLTVLQFDLAAHLAGAAAAAA